MSKRSLDKGEKADRRLTLELGPVENTSNRGVVDDDEYIDTKDIPRVMTPKTSDEVGGSSDLSTAAHMFISFIGAGVLGLPFAFMKTGVLGSLIVLPVVGFLSTYTMMILVDCKSLLEGQGKQVRGYGDIGFAIGGEKGSLMVDILLVITQTAFCVAYLIFIGENLSSLKQSLSDNEVIAMCIPGLSLLVLFRQIKNLSPFTLVADFANILGALVVVTYDIEIFAEREEHEEHPLDKIVFGVVMANIPYFVGISLYCYEGVGVIIPIQASMRNKENFKPILTKTMFLVTLVYVIFGTLGYIAYTTETKEIITLNLGEGIPTKIVKVALSIGLFFTYPLMMFPVYTIVESTSRLSKQNYWVKNIVRVGIVLLSVGMAVGIPNFGDFISLVGAGACAALALVLPAFFHIRLFEGKLSKFQLCSDYCIVVAGIVFGIAGTINAGRELFSKF